MRILVIGSKGFIGHHMLNHLIQSGHEVYGSDVIVDYKNPDSYFLIDASNSDYTSVFQKFQYNLCVNCSGAASVSESMIKPTRDYFLNTVNVYKMLESIKNYQSNCKFINLSSAAVYGNPESLPISENSKINPLSPYGIHKYQSEQICKEFHDFWGVPTCSLRIFSVYGIGLYKQLFYDLHTKVKNGKPFTLFGNGNESRDFINIFDLVKAIEIVSEKSNFNGEIINIANGEEIFIKDAVSIFLNFYNEKILYSFSGEIRKGDPTNWKADISKIESFGYKPSISIKKGLKDYYDWLIYLEENKF